jgi:HSP20 family protein
MLMRTDPFRELDRLTQQMLGTVNRSSLMALDAYRKDDWFYVHFDLPGVDPDSIDVEVEQNVLTVKAERPGLEEGVETVVAERPRGAFTRQVFLGETLNSDKLEADYDVGVLTLRIPVADQAKPRRISVSSSGARKEINA